VTDFPTHTSPPGRYAVLYDGQCKLCTAGSQRLVGMARRGAVERVDFQAPGALEAFPGLTHDACMKQMVLIAPDGRIFGGFEAAVRAVATRPVVGWFAYLYYLPGLRQLCEVLYRWIAAHRYRLFGKAECDSGTCAVHLGPR
jgi:predicted DCC family thiol-disulfide oxidoreductase YuxK